MSGIQLSIDDSEVRGVLARLNDQAANKEDALNAIGAYGVFSTQRRFEREAGPDGKPWARLSPRTAKRRKDGYAHILRQSGRLKDSITYAVARDSVRWGSHQPYASIHQLGGTIEMPGRTQTLTFKRTRQKGGGFISRFAKMAAKGSHTKEVAIGPYKVRIPARPFLGLDEADKSEIKLIVEDHFRDQGGNAA